MRWLADENFDNDIVRGVLRRATAFDIVRVQDIGLAGEDDSVLLDWATRNVRTVLTHDLSTMIPAVRQRLALGYRCAPIVLVPDSLAIGAVIDEILLLDACAVEDDWAAGVLYLPLR